MKLAEAVPLLKEACGVPFKKLFEDHPEDLYTNKGNVGQMLLKLIGLKLDSNLTDFEDGELKTNKTRPDGRPRETIFITQISRTIDTLVGEPRTPFEVSNVYEKVKNLLVVPVVKDAPMTKDWYFLNVAHINLEKNPQLRDQLESDYHVICDQLVQHIENGRDGLIHTANGYYLQTRTKASKNSEGTYTPIFSKTYRRAIANKNHAFYFQKRFMLDVVAGKFD